VIQAPFWLYFPISGREVAAGTTNAWRLAASFAIDRPTINQALTLGFSQVTEASSPTTLVLLAAASASFPPAGRRNS